ncbi:FHA domain-containing protein [Pseudonocardia abyssalis]|uniref:FHA domain-containing protein n=1 Tax=Pseudonocardia abyssalis TaxID=2792008 RepID=UPI001CF6C18C|nr:FHA domain-containing protein [Pseudonocardia abyssalis]
MPDRLLPTSHGSLAHGVPAAAPATIFALSVAGGISVGPKEGRTLVFGRNRPEVHVCVGEDDPRVSREHGVLGYRADRWWIRNTGRLPVRLPGGRLLFAEEEPVPLTEGYTPVFVRGSAHREHLLELFVTGADGGRPAARHRDATQQPVLWRLDDDERLVLVVLGQRYLLHENRPQPLSWRQAADQLAELQPDAGWTSKRVEHAVTAIRTRMSRGGVPGLTREEVGEPVGNALNDNLIRELVLSTTLVPPDLEMLGDS